MATFTTTATSQTTARIIAEAADTPRLFRALYDELSVIQGERIAAGETDAEGNPLGPLPAFPDLEESGDVVNLGRVDGGTFSTWMGAASAGKIAFDFVDAE